MEAEVNKMTKQPSYRFAGYTEAWEQRKLGEVMNVTSVKRIHQSDWADNGIRFLRARDIVSASKNEEPDDYLYISKEKYDEYSLISGKVAIGDLLVTGVGTIGVPYLIRNSEPLYFKDGNIIWFQNGTKIDGDFFIYSFFGKAIQDFINESAGIGTVGTYTIESGKKTPISFPKMKEQQKIGIYFRKLDNLITLHQRKLEVLKEQKKTYLKLLFPAKGQIKPALRFTGFEDEWKEVKLGKFVDISKGTQRNKEFLSPIADDKNCYPVYNGGKQESGYTDEFNRDANIMISEGGASAGFVNYFDGKYWSGGHNFTIDELENDIFYVLALLESKQQELYLLQVGSGLPNIQLGSLKDIIITYPILSEQKAIGSFFQDLDKAIAKQEEKVNQLKESKQTLLRKMFI